MEGFMRSHSLDVFMHVLDVFTTTFLMPLYRKYNTDRLQNGNLNQDVFK